jgi:hypothetical protein
MSVDDNLALFSDEEMKGRWKAVYDFLCSDGACVGIDKDSMLRVLAHMGEALHSHPANESLWKAFVLVDVLIDTWDECVAVFKEEEVGIDNAS